jgi:hypothetical protein
MDTGANIDAYKVPADERPSGMLEAIILFGGLAIILQGIGAVIGRLNGIPFAVCACFNPFLYAAAGFMAARHWTIANGVWAGIAVASLDAVLGQLLSALILPETYRNAQAELVAALPGGALIFIIVIAVFATLIGVLLFGSLFGVIGAAISHSGPFRPRYRYHWE